VRRTAGTAALQRSKVAVLWLAGIKRDTKQPRGDAGPVPGAARRGSPADGEKRAEDARDRRFA